MLFFNDAYPKLPSWQVVSNVIELIDGWIGNFQMQHHHHHHLSSSTEKQSTLLDFPSWPDSSCRNLSRTCRQQRHTHTNTPTGWHRAMCSSVKFVPGSGPPLQQEARRHWHIARWACFAFLSLSRPFMSRLLFALYCWWKMYYGTGCGQPPEGMQRSS